MKNNKEKSKMPEIKARNCHKCGKIMPSAIRYEFAWCWMCVRDIWEAGHFRYYVTKRVVRGITYWEEVQSLRGIDGFAEKNKGLIKEKMTQAKEELNNSENKIDEF